MRALAQYWQTGYDWRKVEARLNALPQFVTNIDGVDIHFIRVRSRHPNALPIIMTHGWPGSIIEQMKVIDPLTNPTAYGGSASDAFDVVIPSLPGHGFSGKPTTLGWNPGAAADLGDGASRGVPPASLKTRSRRDALEARGGRRGGPRGGVGDGALKTKLTTNPSRPR